MTIIATRYFFLSLLLLTGAAVFIDRVLLPSSVDAQQLTSKNWKWEDINVCSSMNARNHARLANPVWRSDGFPVPIKATKSKRILVLGDSFVWGHGYSNMNTIWWRCLQRELVTRGYDDVEVIAAGLSCATTQDQLLWAKELLPVYKPDLVIWGYVTNDPDTENLHGGTRLVEVLWEPPVEPLAKKIRDRLSKLLPNLSEQLFQVRDMRRLQAISGSANAYELGEWELKLLEGENFSRYQNVVADLAQWSKQAHTPMFMITLPSGFMRRNCANSNFGSKDQFLAGIEEYYSARYAPVKKLFDKEGFEFIDTLEEFIPYLRSQHFSESSSPLRLGINPANGHPGPLITHFHALTAADVLESKYPQCLGEKHSNRIYKPTPRFNDWLPIEMGFKEISPDTVSFQFPKKGQVALWMPIRKPYVQMNFETPVKLKSIELTGKCLVRAEIYLSCLDPLTGYDDGSLQSLTEQRGSKLRWSAPEVMVNTVRVHARFKGNDRSLVMKYF